MKIALLTICRDERVHLPDFVKWNKCLFDAFYAYDDNSSDNTKEYLLENGFKVIGGKYSFFKSEMLIRSNLLEYAKSASPDIDWFFFLDADELLLCDRLELECLLARANRQKCTGIEFNLVNLWRSTHRYRVDNNFDNVRKVHAWKNSEHLRFKVESGLHKQLQPHSISKILVQKHVRIIHLGFSSSAKIVSKFIKYGNLGQQGDGLWRLIDERTLKVQSIENLKYSIGSRFYQWYSHQEKISKDKNFSLIELMKREHY